MAQASLPHFASCNKYELDNLAKTTGRLINARVTIIASDGTVLGDSEYDFKTMENHAAYPEIMKATAAGVGISTRYNTTLKQRILYVAVPVVANSEVIGTARVALPLDTSHISLNTLIASVALTMVLATSLVILAAAIITRRVVNPIKQITQAATRMAAGELEQRIPILTSDESGQLAKAFNEMSSSLKEMVTQISEERSKLSNILNNITDGLIMTDAEGLVLRINQAAERLFNIEEAKAVGQHLIEVVRDHDIDRILKLCLKTSRQHSTQLELGISKRFLRVVAVPIMTDGRTLTGAGVMFQDLTEMKSLQTMRQEFIGNISHELRTPLASIKAIVETLHDGAINSKKVAKHFLTRIDNELDRMMQMVLELTELSRIESSRGELKPEMVDLNVLVADAIARLQPQAERKKVTLSANLLTSLPPIHADKHRIYQVITNLVHNAIKFTPPGGKVNISTELSENSVLVKVSDTGIGISKDDLPRIFERFYKADKARAEEGAGLGLAIAKHVVLAHGGNIWAESKEGKGSTFFFTLPHKSNSQRAGHKDLTNP